MKTVKRIAKTTITPANEPAITATCVRVWPTLGVELAGEIVTVGKDIDVGVE